jgi:hypothetical protein
MDIKAFTALMADTVSVEKSRRTTLVILAFTAGKISHTNIALTISFVQTPAIVIIFGKMKLNLE